MRNCTGSLFCRIDSGLDALYLNLVDVGPGTLIFRISLVLALLYAAWFIWSVYSDNKELEEAKNRFNYDDQ